MLPQGFVEYISHYPQLAPLATDLLTEPAVSVRLNATKDIKLADLPQLPIADKVPWADNGYYLSQRPAFTFDPALHQGLYYVQDASSMALQAAIKQITDQQPIRYLDICAAPGGKTTLAIDSLPHGSLIVANEYDFKRAEILAENITKWGNPNAMVTRGDTAQYKKLSDFFDIVAIDAPCSGEGMMRKDQQAINQWSPQLVQKCADTQRDIICNAWHALRPGGFLIYSTCTFNRFENEENVQWMVDELNAIPIEINALSQIHEVEKGIDTDWPCYRFLPGKIKGEGLFLAVLQKPGQPQSRKAYMHSKNKSNSKIPIDASPARLLKNPENWSTSQIGDEIFALPTINAPAMLEVAKNINTILPGLHIASIKGKDVIPAHALSLSAALNKDAFARVSVDFDSAIAYLQRQAIILQPDTPRGYVLVEYNGRPIGFVKNLGNRSNNLYPKNWRILSNLR